MAGQTILDTDNEVRVVWRKAPRKNNVRDGFINEYISLMKNFQAAKLYLIRWAYNKVQKADTKESTQSDLIFVKKEL